MTAVIKSKGKRRFPTAPPDSLIAAVLLAFLATAGLFYVNIMPALVSGLVDGLGFSQRNAGLVGSANVYGAALGALIAVFLIKRIAWRPTAFVALIAMIAIDLISTFMKTPEWLIGTRFCHGIIGGLLVGIGFAVIARTRVPDRSFGMLLVVQYGLGGLGVLVLPRLVPLYGTPVLFLALSAFSLVTLAMLPFLADYPKREAPATKKAGTADRSATRWLLLALALIAVFLFQAGNMALSAYMIELGRAYGQETNFISTALGFASWLGVGGALLVVFLGTRFGRFRPLAIAFALTVVGNAAFHFSGSTAVFAAANIGTAMTWAFVIPYLLGQCAAFDATGQTATLGGFFSKMGLATGPLVGGMLLNETHYELLINVSVAVLALSSIAALIPAYRLKNSANIELREK